MRVVEPGHIYEFHTLDGDGKPETLTFVNREPGQEHAGTQTQEVLRGLIDRTMHCDNCLRWPLNDLIIHHMRMALVLHEMRGLERKSEKGIIRPECVPISLEDGHFLLSQFPQSGEALPQKGQETEDGRVYRTKDKSDSPYRAKMPSFCAKK